MYALCKVCDKCNSYYVLEPSGQYSCENSVQLLFSTKYITPFDFEFKILFVSQKYLYYSNVSENIISM